MNHNKLFSIIFSATAVCLPIAANGTAIGHDTVTETDFKTKEAYTGDSLATAWLNAQTGLTPEERDAIKFLYAYMPLADGNGYAPEFFLPMSARHCELPKKCRGERLSPPRIPPLRVAGACQQ